MDKTLSKRYRSQIRYRYFVDFRHGISVFANFYYVIVELGTPQCPLLEELKFYGKMEFLKNVQVNRKFFRRYGAETQNFCRL